MPPLPQGAGKYINKVIDLQPGGVPFWAYRQACAIPYIHLTQNQNPHSRVFFFCLPQDNPVSKHVDK